MKREYPSTPKEAFELAVEGAYYEKELWLARRQNRIGKVPYDPAIPVHTAWDLWGAGGGDETAVWFVQLFANEVRVIDYFEWNGMSMKEIINFQILNKEYKYGKHIFPHDARVHEYTTGSTREKVARELLWNVEVLDISSISDGIDAVRSIFPRCWFDEENCSIGLTRLGSYHKKFVKSLGKYIDQPDHDGSNWPDAFRYMAISLNKLVKKEVKPMERTFFNRKTGKIEKVS